MERERKGVVMSTDAGHGGGKMLDGAHEGGEEEGWCMVGIAISRMIFETLSGRSAVDGYERADPRMRRLSKRTSVSSGSATKRCFRLTS